MESVSAHCRVSGAFYRVAFTNRHGAAPAVVHARRRGWRLECRERESAEREGASREGKRRYGFTGHVVHPMDEAPAASADARWKINDSNGSALFV